MNFTEDNISQIPALRLLVTLGYTYLTPAEAMALRDGKNTSVLLEPVLKEQLKKINHIKIVFHYFIKSYKLFKDKKK